MSGEERAAYCAMLHEYPDRMLGLYLGLEKGEYREREAMPGIDFPAALRQVVQS